MLENNKRYALLQLFSEGGGGDGGTSGGASAEGTLAMSNNANVVYGKQDAAEGNNVATNRAEEFEKMIKGDFKEYYDAKVKDTITKRLKNSQETIDKYNKVMPMLEKLGGKYGVDYNDIDALGKAMDEDDSYYEQEALERGLTVEQLKDIKKMEKENSELKKQMEEQARKDNADKLYSQWLNEEQQIKQIYPQFNLQEELRNPQFANLIQNNTSMRAAYEVCHLNEIMPNAMHFAVNQTQQKIANSIVSNGMRPKENGQGSTAPATVKDNVLSLTKADRERINEQVRMGKKIRF